MELWNFLLNNQFFNLVTLAGLVGWLIWDLVPLGVFPRWIRVRADPICRAGQKVTLFGIMGLLLESLIVATEWPIPFLAKLMLTFVLTSLALKFHRTCL